MTTKTYIGLALFIGLLGMQAQAAPEAIMQNLTTGTDLLSDNFEGVSADSGAYVPNGGDYDPIAGAGTWLVGENEADNAQIQVTSYEIPGALYGDQYLRTIKNVYGDIEDQSTVGDHLRFKIAINLDFGAEIRLLGDSNGEPLYYHTQDFIRLNFTSTLLRYQNAAGTVVDSGLTNYVKNTWGVLTIDYVVGSDEYIIGYNGETVTITGLAPTLGIPTSVDGFFLHKGSVAAAHFDSEGASAPDFDNDGLPDAWELLYFGDPTNANPSAIASNGVNTLLETYIAGLDPIDPADLLEAVLTDGSVIQWGSVSGRVYSVWWSSDLRLESFQPLQTNIFWPQSSYTNPASGSKAFYRIEVQLPE